MSKVPAMERLRRLARRLNLPGEIVRDKDGFWLRHNLYLVKLGSKSEYARQTLHFHASNNSLKEPRHVAP